LGVSKLLSRIVTLTHTAGFISAPALFAVRCRVQTRRNQTCKRDEIKRTNGTKSNATRFIQ
jgi:hypothetical protein